MPTTRSAWRQSAVGVIGTPSLANQLQAWNDLFVAEVAANPGTALWEVSAFSAVNGTLELKRRDASNGRILLFGGSTPNVAAVHDNGSLSALSVYGLWAPTAATTGPTTAYTSGDPYATLNTGGMVFQTSGETTTSNRVQYWENAHGVAFIVYLSSGVLDTGLFVCGNLIDDVDDTPVDMAFSNGNTALGVLALTLSNAASKFWNVQATALATASKTCILRSSARQRGMSINSMGMTNNLGVNAFLRSIGGDKNYLYPIPFVAPDLSQFIGNLRQINIGPRASIGYALDLGSGRKAYALSADSAALADAIWLTD